MGYRNKRRNTNSKPRKSAAKSKNRITNKSREKLDIKKKKIIKKIDIILKQLYNILKYLTGRKLCLKV